MYTVHKHGRAGEEAPAEGTVVSSDVAPLKGSIAECPKVLSAYHEGVNLARLEEYLSGDKERG